MVDAPTQEANYETLGTDDASQNLENGQSQPKTEQKSKDENPSRETWTNQFQFGIHSLAFMVGGGNLWRFPFLVHKYGGGTFVTVYWIMFFLASVPLVFLEFFLGQFHSQGPINIFRHMAPAFEGIGWAIMLVNLSSTITYNALLAWSLYYFASSFDPPWSKCRYGLTQWNSEHCYSIPAMQQCLGDGKEQKWFVKGRCYDELNISKLLHHIDDCYDNVWLRRDRMEGREARKHFSNCSFAFQLKFHPQRKAAAFLFGKNATWDTNRVSSCIGKKAGQCVFLKVTEITSPK